MADEPKTQSGTDASAQVPQQPAMPQSIPASGTTIAPTPVPPVPPAASTPVPASTISPTPTITPAPAAPKPQAASSEVTANDLLSLWGSGTKSSAPAATPKPMSAPAAIAPAPATSAPVAPKPMPTPAAPMMPKPVPAPTPMQTTPPQAAPVPQTPAATPTPAPKHVAAPTPSASPAPMQSFATAQRAQPPPQSSPQPQAAAGLPWQTSKSPPSMPPPPKPAAHPQPTAQAHQPIGHVAATPTHVPSHTPKHPQPQEASRTSKTEDRETELVHQPHKPNEATHEKKTIEEQPKPKPKPKEEKSTLIEGQLVNETSEPDLLPENEMEESPIREFFKDINISRKQVFCSLGCIVFVIVLGFGGLYGYRWYKNRGAPTAPTTQPVPPPVTQSGNQNETGISSSNTIGQNEFVSPRHVTSTGLDATIALGTEAEEITGITYYLDTFRRMQNAYATDIKELLNKSLDRKARLESYLILLRNLDTDGRKIEAEILSRMQLLQNEYTIDQQTQTTLDAQFFTQVGAFDGSTSEKTLTYFIQVTKNMAAVRSQYKALQKIDEYYAQGLPRLEQRIHDIELNTDPLVAGITVYQVEGSDLHLIVPVVTGTEESLNTSGFPLLNTKGNDFISTPGGGFSSTAQPSATTTTVPPTPPVTVPATTSR